MNQAIGPSRTLFPALNSYWIKKAFKTFHPNVIYHTCDNASDETHVIEWAKTHFLGKDSLPVWSGGSAKTIYAKPEDNYLFRAWHDTIHIKKRLGFDYDSEILVGLHQIFELKLLKAPDSVILAVYFDTIGQVEYYHKHGHHVDDQRAFVEECLKQGKIAA